MHGNVTSVKQGGDVVRTTTYNGMGRGRWWSPARPAGRMKRKRGNTIRVGKSKV